MTSPDFMYPQPTDDELAAQQPRTAAIGNRGHGASGDDIGTREARVSPAHGAATSSEPSASLGSSGPRAGSARLGTIALALAIIGAGLSLIASVFLGMTVGPMEAASGYHFSDTPSWYRNVAIGIFSLQALCTALGIAGLIMGIVATVSGRGRTQGIVATAIALLAPVISFGAFLIFSFSFA